MGEMTGDVEEQENKRSIESGEREDNRELVFRRSVEGEGSENQSWKTGEDPSSKTPDQQDNSRSTGEESGRVPCEQGAYGCDDCTAA